MRPGEERIELPCGGLAVFDHSSGISYVCETCLCTVGSVGMPSHCKTEFQKEDMWKALKS